MGDPDRIVAIEVVGPQAPTLEVGDTLALSARALNARGEIVPDAPVVWHVLDTGQVGVTLDTATGFLTAVAPGAWRIQARVEALATAPITVTVNEPQALAPMASRAEHRQGRPA